VVGIPKPKNAKDGAPRWTYVAAAIVAIGGLVWGIVSFFIPKPEVPKAPTAASAPTVSVSGSGSVGVATMSGGQISVGAPATQPGASPSVPAKAGSDP